VQVNGSGGNGPNGSHYGVVVTGGGTITSGGGDVTVAGTGGTGPNGSNHGVLVSGGTISAGGTGNVTVQGSGGSGGAPNYGVYVVGNNSAITSAGGMVLVQGFGGANSAAVRLDGGGAIASGNNATVGVSGDSLQFGGTTPGTISAGTGTVFLAAASPGTLIDLGGADVLSGPQLVLGVSAADLAQVTAGTLAVGGVGDVKVSAALDLSVRFGTLALISGGSIADANASGTDLKVAHLILSAGTGIGSGNPLETAVSKLTAVNTTSGTVEVSNTGPLTIDHAPPADAGGEADETGIKNTGGGVTVTTTGDLTVGASVSAGGDVALTSIGGGVQVGAPITADGFTVAVSAAGAITHAAGAGATVTAAGLVLQATSGIGLATAAGNLAAKNTTNNIQIINTGDLTVTTVGTVGGVTLSGVADPGGSVDINTTGDLTVDRPVTAGGVTQLTGGTGGGSAITLNATVGGTAVIVNGGPGADTFTLRSSPTVPLTVNGFEPAAPTTPGDALNFNANGLAVVYAASPLVAGTDKPVSVNGIETRTVYNFSTVIFTTDANAAVDIDLRRLIDPALLAANPTFTAGGAVNGTVTLLADGHTARFLPGPNSSAGGVGFTFTANGSGPFNVNVLVNHPPTVAAPAALTAYEDMDKAVTGITVGDPDSGRLTVTLKVGHGTLTLGTTAGLTVTGNGSASVTLSGDIAALNTALATLFYRGGLNYGGADTLSLTASDGSLGTAGSVAITVKSAAQQAADLQAQVTALQSRGVLTPGLANKLTSKLVLRGRAEDAGLVQEFLEKVQDFLRAGVLTQAQADALLGPGNILLLSVTRR
jgi:hypothetical protein